MRSRGERVWLPSTINPSWQGWIRPPHPPIRIHTTQRERRPLVSRDLRQPAIRKELHAIDIAGRVAREKHRDMADLARLSNSPERALLCHRLDNLVYGLRAGRLAERSPQRRRVDGARTQDVDADPVPFRSWIRARTMP